MTQVKLHKQIRSVGSDCQLYSDEDGNSYIKLRYVDASDNTVSHWYYKRVIVDDEGNFHMALGSLREEAVELADGFNFRRPIRRSDVMPPSIPLD